MREKADLLVPVFAGNRRQVEPKRVVVGFLGGGAAALAEELEKGGVIQTANAGRFQFQKGVLDRVHIYGVDFACPGDQVIEGVAAGAGDDQDTVFGLEL